MERFKNRREKPQVSSQINVTNLVDVTLVILIIFILIAPLIEHGIRVQLPKASQKRLSDPLQLTLKITKDNRIYLGDIRLTKKELAHKLSIYAKVNPDIAVNVQGDARVVYQELVDVLDLIRTSGITKIGLATEVDVER